MERVLKKYGPELDTWNGDYHTKGEVNTEMPVFKWDYTYHMTEEELKNDSERPQSFHHVQSFDLEQAERVHYTAEMVHQMLTEREMAAQIEEAKQSEERQKQRMMEEIQQGTELE